MIQVIEDLVFYMKLCLIPRLFLYVSQLVYSEKMLPYVSILYIELQSNDIYNIRGR